MKAIRLVKRALRVLGVVAEGNEPSADMVADGLDALGAMLAGWELRGVRIGAPAEIQSDTVLPLAARERDVAVRMLAAALAPEYGRDPTPHYRQAARDFAGMQAQRLQPRVLRRSEWDFYGRRYGDIIFGGGGGIVVPPVDPPPVDPPPVDPPPPGTPFPIVAEWFGINVERNYNINNASGDGIPADVIANIARGSAGARFVRAFVFFTPEIGHGTRTQPAWPANPLGNVNFSRLINTIDRYVAAGMPVIYAFIPGPYGLDQFTQDPTQLDRASYLAYLTAGAAWFAQRYTPAQMVLQPWNETFSGNNNGSAATTNQLIAETYAALRMGAPNHWLIFSGPDYGRVWRLADVVFPTGATRVAADVHDYEVIDGGDGTYFGRTTFIQAQRQRLNCPVVFGEIDPARALFTNQGFDLDDPRRITVTRAFAQATGSAVGLWAWCEGSRSVNDPAGNNSSIQRWRPQLENVLVPGTHTITVNAPTGGTFTLPHALTISGTYTGRPSAIEARVGNSAWTNLDTSPTGGTFSGTFSVTAPGSPLAVEVRFANGRAITAATSVNIAAAGTVESITVAGVGGENAATYMGTYTPTSPTPTIFVYAVQGGVDVAMEPPDTIGGGNFSGGMTGLPAGTTTFRAEMLSGPEAFSSDFVVEVDNTSPTIESIVPPPVRNYKTGDFIDAFTRMTEPITVVEGSETPFIEVNIGPNTRKMTFLSGPTAQDLTWRYQVDASDSDNDGIAVANTVNLAGGSMTDAAGNPASLAGLAWGGNPALIRVNQPEVTLNAPPPVVGVGLSIVATGTVFPDNTNVEVVWRQGGADVGAAVQAVEDDRAWTATINAPAIAGTYTLRARHTGNGAILADSAAIAVSAAGATAIPYNSGMVDVRADEVGTITTVDGGVSAWTSGQSLAGVLAQSVAANQPQHSSLEQSVSYGGGSANDVDGDWSSIVNVRDRYRANGAALGVFYMLIRRTQVPAWNWTIARVGANNTTYTFQFARAYGLTLLGGGTGLRIIRQGNTSGTYVQSDINGWAGEGWLALGWVLNDSRASGIVNGTAESISRLFVKTKPGGSFPTMVSTATTSGTIIANDTSALCDIGRSRWNGSSASGQCAGLSIHSLGFDANPPISDAGIETALNQLLARV